MYLDFFGLREKPFSLTPDPRFLFLSESHRQALDHMLYGVREREGFILIVGDIGTGKTTICRELLEKLDRNTASALILNPLLSEIELLEAILQDFGILASPVSPESEGEDSKRILRDLDPETQTALELNPMMPAGKVLENILRKVEKPSVKPSKKELIDRLNAYLLERAANGGNAVLIIDEAQNLSLPVLEQIRILSNLETPRQKLLQIVLVGQLELKRKLEQAGLRQLNQRISVRYQIKPMSLEESKRYIEHRLFVAGSNASVSFSDEAHRMVYDYSLGVPRLINVMCERCLLGAFVDQSRNVDAALVTRCRRSLDSNMDEDNGESGTADDQAGDGETGIDEGGESPGRPAPMLGTRREALVPESVKQPWERKRASGKGGGRLKPVVAALALVTLLLAGALGWYLQKGKPSVGGKSSAPVASAVGGTTPARDAAVVPEAAAADAVELTYSIQLGAFQNLEDALEQMRLLTEHGVGEGLYVVPLHLVQLGGRWHRLFYGGFPSTDAARLELLRLTERGTVAAGSARIVQTPLAFKLGDYDTMGGAEKDRQDYLSRLRIPSYALALGNGTAWRLYAGAFEEREQASYLADRLDESGIKAELIRRTGQWSGNR